MKMNKEEYERLLKRFALELSEVGVTDNLVEMVKGSIERTPNIASVSVPETTDRFIYRHDGYMIEAERVVKLTVKRRK